jgi:putative membrane protein
LVVHPARVRGSVLPGLLPRIGFIVAIGVVAVEVHHGSGVKLAPIAHTILGVALGLLLVFRTNASYDRYWEGRRLLGVLVNRSRDLARQLVAFLARAGLVEDVDEDAAVGAEDLGVLSVVVRTFLDGHAVAPVCPA